MAYVQWEQSESGWAKAIFCYAAKSEDTVSFRDCCIIDELLKAHF